MFSKVAFYFFFLILIILIGCDQDQPDINLSSSIVSTNQFRTTDDFYITASNQEFIDRIELNWKGLEDACFPEEDCSQSYQIYRSLSLEGPFVFLDYVGCEEFDTGFKEYVDWADSPNGPIVNIFYYYFIEAYDYEENILETSNVVLGSVSPLKESQSIAFVQDLSGLQYGDPDFQLEATASSGLPVSFISSDPTSLSIDGQIASIKKATPPKTYVIITARQDGDDNYFEAPKVTQKVSINKRALHVIINNASRQYGDPDPEFTATYSGWGQNDNEDNYSLYSLDIITDAERTDSFGKYNLFLAEGYFDYNYEITFTPANLYVLLASLKVKADDKIMVYGDPIPELTMSYLGFKFPGETIEKPPTLFVENVDSNSPVGVYEIIVKLDWEARNYALEVYHGELEIVKATPDIDWNPAGLVYGDLLGEDQLNASSSVRGQFIYSPLAGILFPVGEDYELQVVFNPEDNHNYNSASASQKIDVFKKKLSVRVDDVFRKYGEDNPTFHLIYEGWVEGEGVDDLIAIPEPTSQAKVDSEVGVYNIIIAGGEDESYEFEYQESFLIIEQAVPVISCFDDINLTEGMNLTEEMINPQSSVPGVFSYQPLLGVYTSPGFYSLKVTFTPNDLKNYLVEKKTIQIDVNEKITPLIIWEEPDSITYGQFLGESQLNALAVNPVSRETIPGSYLYTPSSGEFLSAGLEKKLRVQFIPNDLALFNKINSSVEIEVQKKDLVIKAVDQQRLYGEPNLFFSFQSTGWVLDDSWDNYNFSTPLEVITSANFSSPVGEYEISKSMGQDSNYEIIFQKAYLTIIPAPVVATVLDVVKFYGEPFPEFEILYQGLKNDEIKPKIEPKVVTEAHELSDVGTYDLFLENDLTKDENYSFIFKSGTLAVIKAFPLIEWQPVSLVYGTSLTSDHLGALARNPFSDQEILGSYSYFSAAGDLLQIGDKLEAANDFILKVTFMPSPVEALNYESQTSQVELVITKANQEILFPSVGNKNYGDSPFSLEASATSGLPVIYYNSNPSVVKLNGNFVTILALGQATITALQSGNQFYHPAVNQAITLEINKGKQVINLPEISDKEYGQSFYLDFTGGSSGNEVEFKISGPGQISDNYLLNLTGIGLVEIEAFQEGNDFYEPASPVFRTFLVKCSLEIANLMVFSNNVDSTLAKEGDRIKFLLDLPQEETCGGGQIKFQIGTGALLNLPLEDQDEKSLNHFSQDYLIQGGQTGQIRVKEIFFQNQSGNFKSLILDQKLNLIVSEKSPSKVPEDYDFVLQDINDFRVENSFYHFSGIKLEDKKIALSGRYAALALSSDSCLEDCGLEAAWASDILVGRVYLYEQDPFDLDWHFKTILYASKSLGGSDNSQFGVKVDISNNRLLVGARDESQDDVGDVYLYELNDSKRGWSVQKLDEDKVGSYYFGSSFSINGDYAVVGILEREDLDNRGSVFIYNRQENQDGFTWSKMADFFSGKDYFGRLVSLSGYDLVVANNYLVYFYERQGNFWENLDVSSLVTENFFYGDHLIKSVSLSNGRVAISVQDGLFKRIYLLDKLVGGNWQEWVGTYEDYPSWQSVCKNKYFQALEIDYRDRENEVSFGDSLALSGDYLLVGVPEANLGSINQAGKIYVYKNQIGHWALDRVLGEESSFLRSKFGLSLALSGFNALVTNSDGVIYPYTLTFNELKKSQEAFITSFSLQEAVSDHQVSLETTVYHDQGVNYHPYYEGKIETKISYPDIVKNVFFDLQVSPGATYQIYISHWEETLSLEGFSSGDEFYDLREILSLEKRLDILVTAEDGLTVRDYILDLSTASYGFKKFSLKYKDFIVFEHGYLSSDEININIPYLIDGLLVSENRGLFLSDLIPVFEIEGEAEAYLEGIKQTSDDTSNPVDFSSLFFDPLVYKIKRIDGAEKDYRVYVKIDSKPSYWAKSDEILYVSKSGDDQTGIGTRAAPYATISKALGLASQRLEENAFTDIVVLVREGVYLENLVWPETDGLKLIAHPLEEVILDGGYLDRVITFDSASITGKTLLHGLKITKGQASVGGGIYCFQSSPTLLNLLLFKNKAFDSGGGIYLQDVLADPLVLENLTISDNESQGLGSGICVKNSSVELWSSIVWDNDGSASIYLEGQVDSIEKNVLKVSYSNLQKGEEGIFADNSQVFFHEKVRLSLPEFTGSYLETNSLLDPLFAGNSYLLSEDSPCKYLGRPPLITNLDEGLSLAPENPNSRIRPRPDIGFQPFCYNTHLSSFDSSLLRTKLFFDVDGDGVSNALTDGLILHGYLNCDYLDEEILLDSVWSEKEIIKNIESRYYLFDINGDGLVTPHDTLLVLRYLFELDSGRSLLAEAIDSNCHRYSSDDDSKAVEAHFEYLLGK